MSLWLKILSPLLMKFQLKTVIFIWLVCMLMLLFTNILLNETIYICVKKLFQNTETLVIGISKNCFPDLIILSTKESFFIFNNNFHIQLDGVAMGSTLGPILVNIFLWHHKESWINKYPKAKFLCKVCWQYFFFTCWATWIWPLVSQIYVL